MTKDEIVNAIKTALILNDGGCASYQAACENLTILQAEILCEICQQLDIWEEFELYTKGK